MRFFCIHCNKVVEKGLEQHDKECHSTDISRITSEVEGDIPCT